MGTMSIGHWAIVVLVIVVLFGRNKISSLMTDLAGGVKNARKALTEIEKDNDNV